MRDQRTWVFAIMVGAALGAGCIAEDLEPALDPETEPAAYGIQTIIPPATAMERPKRVWVLPVIWIADGVSPWQAVLAQATNNLTVHLRVAREKYRLMLKNPVTGASRGSFGLATWSEGFARSHIEGVNDLKPLVIYSPTPYAALNANGYSHDAAIVAEVLDKVGCKVQSCPFVFVIAVAGSDSQAIHAIAFNYGLNGGGGFVRMPLSAATWSYDPARSFQSILLHELGHAFGLMHLGDIYAGPGVTHLPPPPCRDAEDADPGTGAGPGPDPYDNVTNCPLDAYEAYCGAMPWEQSHLEFHCSSSVMSYSKLNWVSGCPDLASPNNCAMPDTATIAAMNGTLIAENVRNLAHNELVFPELAADFDLLADDDDGDFEVQWHIGNGAPDDWIHAIPGHPRMTARSSDSGFDSPARAAFGYHTMPITPSGAPFHPWRMWHSKFVGANAWATVKFDFPEGVELGRVRVFTGYQGGLHAAEEIAVRGSTIVLSGGPPFEVGEQPPDGKDCGATLLRGKVDGEVVLNRTCSEKSSRFRVRVRAGASGYVVIRGIRFFDAAGRELQGPREPVPSTSHGDTGWASSIQNVIGGEQRIESYATFFDPDRMWHSKDVGAGNWVTVDLRLPARTRLTSIVTYTGHGGLYNPASHVRISARGAGGNYIQIKNVATAPSQAISLAGSEPVTHLRLEFRAGPSGHVVVRGIRLFTPWGEEFAPRSVQDPLGPPL